jgi:hypothetical protein
MGPSCVIPRQGWRRRGRRGEGLFSTAKLLAWRLRREPSATRGFPLLSPHSGGSGFSRRPRSRFAAAGRHPTSSRDLTAALSVSPTSIRSRRPFPRRYLQSRHDPARSHPSRIQAVRSRRARRIRRKADAGGADWRARAHATAASERSPCGVLKIWPSSVLASVGARTLTRIPKSCVRVEPAGSRPDPIGPSPTIWYPRISPAPKLEFGFRLARGDSRW